MTIKLNSIALAAAALFAASSLFAHEAAPCCATGGNAKASCEATFAKLDLTAGQKTKMKKLATECDQAGCTKKSLAMMEKAAKGILSKKQFAAWKAACSSKTSDKTQG